jgi:hypothetical protein
MIESASSIFPETIGSTIDAAAREVSFRVMNPAASIDHCTIRVGGTVILDKGKAHCIPLAMFKRAPDYTVTCEVDGTSAPISPEQLAGDFFEAITLPSPERFWDKVQLNHSRYSNRDLLHVAARASFLRFKDSFLVRAAALTILAHRILESNFGQLSPDEKEEIKWIGARAPELVAHGLAEISATDKPHWTSVRWTVSLATVAAYLCLIENDLTKAAEYFAKAASQADHIGLSKVSALNIVNACYMAGMLAVVQKKPEAARNYFEQGVLFFKQAVAVQSILDNVWIIGDLLNVGRASRQCYIAMAIFDLLPPSKTPRVDPKSVLHIREIKSPLHAILHAGLAPDLLKCLLRPDIAI